MPTVEAYLDIAGYSHRPLVKGVSLIATKNLVGYYVRVDASDANNIAGKRDRSFRIAVQKGTITAGKLTGNEPFHKLVDAEFMVGEDWHLVFPLVNNFLSGIEIIYGVEHLTEHRG